MAQSMADDPKTPGDRYPQADASQFLRTHAITGRSSSRIVSALIDSMSRIGWSGPPIAVIEYGSDRYILDGHHRVFAARHAQVLVRYRVVRIDALSRFGYHSLEQVIQAHAEAGPNQIRFR